MAKEPVTHIADLAWRSYCERSGYVNIGDSAARELFKSGFIAALQHQSDSRRHAETRSQTYRQAVSAR